ncbi:hypothetical protein Plhal304r1_c016g0058951 [Plasmopara halstedii]
MRSIGFGALEEITFLEPFTALEVRNVVFLSGCEAHSLCKRDRVHAESTCLVHIYWTPYTKSVPLSGDLDTLR